MAVSAPSMYAAPSPAQVATPPAPTTPATGGSRTPGFHYEAGGPQVGTGPLFGKEDPAETPITDRYGLLEGVTDGISDEVGFFTPGGSLKSLIGKAYAQLTDWIQTPVRLSTTEEAQEEAASPDETVSLTKNDKTNLARKARELANAAAVAGYLNNPGVVKALKKGLEQFSIEPRITAWLLPNQINLSANLDSIVRQLTGGPAPKTGNSAENGLKIQVLADLSRAMEAIDKLEQTGVKPLYETA